MIYQRLGSLTDFDIKEKKLNENKNISKKKECRLQNCKTKRYFVRY